jgi:hypothetical protein
LNFFKDLTQKTLLALSEVIEMRICHPEEIIKKRGWTSGISILSSGKVGLTTNLPGSRFSGTTI